MFKQKSSTTIYATFLMFMIIFLLNLNFTILRSVRSALAVADVGGSASSILYFELFGVLPAAFLMTWLLSRLLRRYTIQSLFIITLLFFLFLFALFAWFYPKAQSWPRQAGVAYTMLFYILGELWKPTLIQMLFWGLINLSVAYSSAKKTYPVLMFGASLGSILAGPTVVLCTSSKIWRWLPIGCASWSCSFNLMLFFLCATGLISGFLYYKLGSLLFITKKGPNDESPISLIKAAQTCLCSPSLKWMSCIVLADYIAYSLGEVLFLEMLKHKFPSPTDFCRYMGLLSFWSSLFTLGSALLLTPVCIKKCRWVTVASLLPISLLLIEGLFFLFLRMESVSSRLFNWGHNDWITCVVWLGSCQYCVCRAIKYTFFDTAKELAFVSIPKQEQVEGKLIIDGLCSRLGRGSASALSLGFITCAGGILASSLLAGITALALSFSWFFVTQKLGKQIEKEEVSHA